MLVEVEPAASGGVSNLVIRTTAPFRSLSDTLRRHRTTKGRCDGVISVRHVSTL
jgi:hypothetical protein